MPKLTTILLVGAGLLIALKYPYVLGLMALAGLALYLKNKDDSTKTGL